MTCQYSTHIGMNFYKCSAPRSLRDICENSMIIDQTNNSYCLITNSQKTSKSRFYHYEFQEGDKIQKGEIEIRESEGKRFMIKDGDLIGEL